MDRLAAELAAVGRDWSEFELVSGIGARFDGPDSIGDLDAALRSFGPKVESGFRTFCIKPCLFVDDARHLPEFLEEVVAKTGAIAADAA
jgi:hypothetical protein